MTISSTGLTCSYTYDAVGVLTLIAVDGRSSRRFWRGSEVVNALSTAAAGESRLTWLRAGGVPVCERVGGIGARTTLLAAAVSSSVLMEVDTAVRTAAYAPHGARASAEAPADAKAEPAFNGELLDAASGCYLLGAGHHRPYSPTLGMFLAPDRASPFGRGGVNALAYCAGDPVNRVDPTGYFWKWIVAAVAVVAAVATLGVMAAAGAAALTASAVVGAAMITSGAGLDVAAALVKDEKLSRILGAAGAVMGLAGGVAAGGAIAKGAANIKARVVRFGQRIGATRSRVISEPGVGMQLAHARSPSVSSSSSASSRISPDAARRLATRGALGRGRFRNPLANGGAAGGGLEQLSGIVDDDVIAQLRQLELARAGREGRVVTQQPSLTLDRTKSPAWTTEGAGGGALDSASGSYASNADEHLEWMAQSSQGQMQRASDVRYAANGPPPGYDEAILPTYDYLPPRYDSHGFH